MTNSLTPSPYDRNSGIFQESFGRPLKHLIEAIYNEIEGMIEDQGNIFEDDDTEDRFRAEVMKAIRDELIERVGKS